MRLVLLAWLAACLAATTATAQERENLGRGSIFTNDFLGDGKDRWRTSSYTVSGMRGQNWDGYLPQGFGELLEFRLRAETIAPANLVAGGPPDRQYAGILSFGVATHFQKGIVDVRLGADMIVTGPQTGIGTLQSAIHRAFGVPEPGAGVLANQIPNSFLPSADVEFSHDLQFTEALSWRPFLAASAGAENLVRVGGDLVLGRGLRSNMMLRDVTTGQLYTGIRGQTDGWSMTLGGDIAKVFSSAYLPAAGGYALTQSRKRLRAGLYREGEKATFFYGVTWLGKEFKAQTSSQVVGSLQITLDF